MCCEEIAVGRIERIPHGPSEGRWQWSCYAGGPSTSGTVETRDEALACVRAHWLSRDEAWRARWIEDRRRHEAASWFPSRGETQPTPDEIDARVAAALARVRRRFGLSLNAEKAPRAPDPEGPDGGAP